MGRTNTVDKIKQLGKWKGSAAELAERIGVSDKTIRRAIGQLELDREVAVTRSNNGFVLVPVDSIPDPPAAEPAAEPDVETVCKKCQSTRRRPYDPNYEIRKRITSRLPDGRRYNIVTWNRTFCLDCGQSRIDQAFLL